jgi:hypothetical protein
MADASGIPAGGDGNVWFADSLAGAGVVGQLVVSTATDDGHATINPSPGIGEPIGILAIAPEPRGTAGSAEAAEASLPAQGCPMTKFVVEQNQATGSNLTLVSADSGPKCAEVEVKSLGFRANFSQTEVKLGIVITNAGPDPAEGMILDLDAYGANGFTASLPNWDCSEIGEHIVCNRSGPLASGGVDIGTFDFVFDPNKGELEVEGTVVSATPDPTPSNTFAEFLERVSLYSWPVPKPPKVRRR